jgi:hypothetical protein
MNFHSSFLELNESGLKEKPSDWDRMIVGGSKGAKHRASPGPLSDWIRSSAPENFQLSETEYN